MSETFDAALRRGAARLAEAGVDDPMRDARALISWAADIDAARLMAAMRDPIADEHLMRYEQAIHDRKLRKPVSHIVGGRLFWGRWFEVTADVLDPRPETEILVNAAIRTGPGRVLDLGVGSGCILGSVLADCENATGVGVDASETALAVSARNFNALGVADRADLRVGDWLTGIEGGFDLVLCNPPYITAAEMMALSPEVIKHEPHLALTPGGDGMAPYRSIAPGLSGVLAPGGRAMFEIGPKQAADITDIFADHGWSAPEVLRDFDGRDRCLVFQV